MGTMAQALTGSFPSQSPNPVNIGSLRALTVAISISGADVLLVPIDRRRWCACLIAAFQESPCS